MVPILEPALTRREFLTAGAVVLGALSMDDAAGGRVQGGGKARCVIQLWMGGGPSHLDTFDPKPEAGPAYTGPLNSPIATAIPGVRISQLLPLLAKQADKYAILRGMTHPSNAHETATYIMQTGTLPSGELVYPAVGAVVALKKGYDAGYKGPLPPYITLTTPLGRFSEAGFLGADYQTFATGGDPSSPSFSVDGMAPPPSLTAERIRDREKLLHSLDGSAAGAPQLAVLEKYRERALSVVLGPARKAFELGEEPEDLRRRYGMHRFGQSCLLARRLVEHGVPFITVNFPGWDTHRNNFPAMARLLPMLDSGFATLLEDLHQRGLLSTTIVTWYGEFGRTPRVAYEEPWEGGRHHYSAAFSAVVAGGGFRGGTVVGETDARGERVVRRPIYPWDLSASIYWLLGIDPHGRLPHPQGCVAYVTPPDSAGAAGGGMLKEIM
ncbi:MAG: DUF1501 domain-containing protein [Chthonomonadales bacterium]